MDFTVAGLGEQCDPLELDSQVVASPKQLTDLGEVNTRSGVWYFRCTITEGLGLEKRPVYKGNFCMVAELRFTEKLKKCLGPLEEPEQRIDQHFTKMMIRKDHQGSLDQKV